VLQGPGCLSYSLILRLEPQGATRNITSTTHYVMSRHAEVLSRLLSQHVEVNGSSDLTIAGKKISGNAQRRKLKSLLFHGTFLLHFDPSLIEKYLQMPPKQPAYRAQRKHEDFLTNIDADGVQLKEALRNAWHGTDEALVPLDRIATLTREKYSCVEWNFKL
jgi:lipoate-protein ligase A